MTPTREEILIGRVVDGEATGADWSELDALARGDGAVWTRLAGAQRSHADLARAVDDELTVAELTEPPGRVTLAAQGAVSYRWRVYSGWAAAAAVALTWATASGLGIAPRVPGVTTSSLGPDALLTQYMDSGKAQGRVLGELPMVMIETTPVSAVGEDGQRVEVVYIRRVLERAVVNGVYTLGQDEHGDPTPVQATTSSLRPARAL